MKHTDYTINNDSLPLMRTLDFTEALKVAIPCSDYSQGGIGTLSEKSLHLILKHYYEPFDQNHEQKLGAFVADAVGEHGIFEIQSRSLRGMERKLNTFLEVSRVTVVYPLVKTKNIIWLDGQSGETRITKSSSRKPTIYFAAPELTFIKKFISHDRFSIRLVFLEADDVRIQKGNIKSRRHLQCDRIPTKLIDELELSQVSDYSIFIPPNLPESFTSNEFSAIAGTPLQLGRSTVYLLAYLGLLQTVGKRGHFNLYRVV